jgi:hypothetical protein
MWNVPSEERLSIIPRLYETEHVPLEEKQIYLHFFIGAADWYIAEYDGGDLFWGFACLGYLMNAEWGYISFSELKSVKAQGFMEVDCELEEHWKVRPAREIELIRKAHDWGTETHKGGYCEESQ